MSWLNDKKKLIMKSGRYKLNYLLKRLKKMWIKHSAIEKGNVNKTKKKKKNTNNRKPVIAWSDSGLLVSKITVYTIYN